MSHTKKLRTVPGLVLTWVGLHVFCINMGWVACYMIVLIAQSA